MTAHYKPVMWNPTKRRYDAWLIAGLVAWIAADTALAALLEDPAQPHGALDHSIKASGLGALLYNRRHLGVTMALLALSHAVALLAWHFGHGEAGFGRWLVTLDLTFGQAPAPVTYGVATHPLRRDGARLLFDPRAGSEPIDQK